MKSESLENYHSFVDKDSSFFRGDNMSTESILHDIEQGLEDLINSGHETVLDISNEVVNANTEMELRAILGHGEVKATLEIFGKDIVQETRIHGVWWVKHLDKNGNVTTKSIYIAYIPSILHAQQEDVEYGLSVLRKKVNNVGK